MSEVGPQPVGEMGDLYGDLIAVKVDEDVVTVVFDPGGDRHFAMCFDAECRDQFIKLWAEAERRAEANAAQAVSG